MHKRKQSIKRETTEWKKIYRKHIPDKGLRSKICKELLQLDNKKLPDKNMQTT